MEIGVLVIAGLMPILRMFNGNADIRISVNCYAILYTHISSAKRAQTPNSERLRLILKYF